MKQKNPKIYYCQNFENLVCQKRRKMLEFCLPTTERPLVHYHLYLGQPHSSGIYGELEKDERKFREPLAIFVSK